MSRGAIILPSSAVFESLGLLPHHEHQTLEEEQEREVAHEVEEEKRVERPPRESPLPHSLSPALVAFASEGKTNLSSWPYSILRPAEALTDIPSVSKFRDELHSFWVSKDYVQTVDTHSFRDLLKPV